MIDVDMSTQQHLCIRNWKLAAQSLAKNGPAGYKVLKTFSAVLDYVHRHEWRGACHASSATFGVLLALQSVHAKLYVGEATRGPLHFDHSWIEVDDEVFDVSISKTLIASSDCPPVFRGVDLSTHEATTLEYGVHSETGYDLPTRWLRRVSIEEYMRVYPGEKQGLFGVVKKIARTVGLRPTMQSIVRCAASLEWVERYDDEMTNSCNVENHGSAVATAMSSCMRVGS